MSTKLHGLVACVSLVACSTGDELSSGAAVASSSVASSSSGAGTGGGGGSGTGAGGGSACVPSVPGPPQKASYPFTLAGQKAWSHDEGIAYGWFHTYDALDVGGPASAPHKVHVLLPRDYDACGPGYPVVYMNDGGAVFWPGGAANETWNVAGALGDLTAAKAIPEVIVVAIEPVDRNLEYSHVQVGPGQTCCQVNAYADYVADAVKGFVDASYHTSPARIDTAIIGSSRGGLAAFYLASRRPEVFGKAGCLSSSFWAGLDPVFGGSYPGGPLSTSALITTLEGTLKNPALRPRMWMDWGLVFAPSGPPIEQAAAARGKEMVGLLEGQYGYAENTELFWFEDPLGAHDEISWARRFPAVMKALFGKM
jgi:pimeloyl-ACP methyl ester carboxylesterase